MPQSATSVNLPAPIDNTAALRQALADYSAHFPEGYPLKRLITSVAWDVITRSWKVQGVFGLKSIIDVSLLNAKYKSVMEEMELSSVTNLRDAGAVHKVARDARKKALEGWDGYDIEVLPLDPFGMASLPRQPQASSRKKKSSAGVPPSASAELENSLSALVPSICWNGNTWVVEANFEEKPYFLSRDMFNAIMLYMSTVWGVQETRSFGSPLDPKSLLKAAGAARSKLLNDETFKRFTIEVPRTVSVSRIEVPLTSVGTLRRKYNWP
ncbi:hypothetical protein TREMEDRAFT_61969 [Tremella mesenterica DSM 1558]|uniref:uncharacterized protein n=1 Tax=Tremella mesenterica (strain ATCC 24925 / CBS 8224 / DSM 1558 / NBRC 9311 / NRRL Y-6157 / RJB 2259-6 / UBC 559-6) TaxID=578456 RepID=UPI0003F4963D|nr:uncharacterized protein TREMEDRAFT_61969 [Tremella mesenterica DSM 1558]EIW70210.1 hypothetical protein TREMEDRAFT_61969 [Tremella mesenterica DSM 1558]